MLLRNHAGRRNMSQWSSRLGLRLGPRVADVLESWIRTANVLISHARARGFAGLVVMDRHLYCQLALRSVRRLPPGRLVPWLVRVLPQPDLVVHFEIDPEQAHERVVLRGTDSETLDDLRALRRGYGAIPQFPEFTRIDAGRAPTDVLAALTDAISGAEANTRTVSAGGSN
jgi:dTMP kinase